MPRKRLERPTEKITIRIFQGDKSRLDELFPKLGHNEVIRKLISKFLRDIDEATSQRVATAQAEQEFSNE